MIEYDAVVTHASDASGVFVEYDGESIHIPVDETYAEDNDLLWELIGLWCMHRGAEYVIDEESEPSRIAVSDLIQRGGEEDENARESNSDETD
jgi:hypothetical protein